MDSADSVVSALNYTQILIGAVVAIVGYLLGSRVVSAVAERFWKRSDEIKDTHITNQGKLIDADQLAMQLLHTDMIELKAEVKELREKLIVVTEQRSDLKAENKILKNTEELLSERIDRQGQKIENLSKELQSTRSLLEESKAALTRRDKEVVTLKSELHETRLEVNAIMVKLANRSKGGDSDDC